jgi:hypothetical protein
MGVSSRSFHHEVCCSCCGIGFPWRNGFGSEVATRGYLRAGIMQFSPLVLSLGATAPSVVAGLLRLTAGTVVCYRTFLVAMVTPVPGIFWGLLAVDQNVAEPLTVAAVCEVSLGFVYFDLYIEVYGGRWG